MENQYLVSNVQVPGFFRSGLVFSDLPTSSTSRRDIFLHIIQDSFQDWPVLNSFDRSSKMEQKKLFGFRDGPTSMASRTSKIGGLARFKSRERNGMKVANVRCPGATWFSGSTNFQNSRSIE
ncbi:hypothetical protein B9Z55_014175 [Caenorhabditis nigoni]|uniref:Uncharacterized protein n=1 Tax=Caenorhabditis nigoni TaxID=1611254 RepID=A0A2G5U5D3_9PELO|nr:hypothetical protein B9Z55_014175 [Caenorhabditis nigoni]